MSYQEDETTTDRLAKSEPKSPWQHLNGKNEKHCKPANTESLEWKISEAEKKLAELKATAGPKKEKLYWKGQIKHFRNQLGERGTEDTRTAKNKNQRKYY